MKTKRTEGESCLNFRRRRRRSSVFGEMMRASHFSASVPVTSYWLAHKEQFCIPSHLAIQVKSIGLRHWEEITALSYMKSKKIISCVRVYWIYHFSSCISHPILMVDNFVFGTFLHFFGQKEYLSHQNSHSKSLLWLKKWPGTQKPAELAKTKPNSLQWI